MQMHIIWQKLSTKNRNFIFVFHHEKNSSQQKKKKKKKNTHVKVLIFWGLQIIVGNYTHNVLMSYMYVPN